MVATDDCEQKSVRVFIGGEEIPTIDSTRSEKPAVETQVRMDGPATINRLTDVQTVANWKGKDVFEALPLDQRDDMALDCQVLARKPQGSDGRQWTIIHRGWLRKIGSGGKGRQLRVKIADYANIAKTIPVSKTYEHGAPTVVLKDMVTLLNKLENMPPVTLNTPYEPVQPEDINVDEVIQGAGTAAIDTASDVAGGIKDALTLNFANDNSSVKEFASGKGDSITDVLNWIASETNSDWFFEPTLDGLTLFFVPRPSLSYTYSANSIGGNVTVRKNESLYNLNPVNAVTLIGNKVQIRDSVEEFGGQYGFVIGKAVHRELLSNSGGRLQEKVVTQSIGSAKKAEKVAKRKLEKELETINSGEMMVDGFPELLPRLNIEAQPVCDQYVAGNAPSLTYGIKKVRHVFPATERYATRLNVGIRVEGGDLISDSGIGERSGDIVLAPGIVDQDKKYEAIVAERAGFDTDDEDN